MPRQPKSKMVENFLDNNLIEELIAFKFSFSITGSYATLEVWSNGSERSGHRPSGSFSGVISPGRRLRVDFRIWDGSYSIVYDCKSGSEKKEDPNKKSPIVGQAMGAQPAIETIYIQF